MAPNHKWLWIEVPWCCVHMTEPNSIVEKNGVYVLEFEDDESKISVSIFQFKEMEIWWDLVFTKFIDEGEEEFIEDDYKEVTT